MSVTQRVHDRARCPNPCGHEIGSATRGEAAQDGLQCTVVWLAGGIAGPTVCAKWGYGGRGSLNYMVCAARGAL